MEFGSAVRQWIRARLQSYRIVHPHFISSLVMMGAAATTALVAIGYAKAMDWATDAMITLSGGHHWAFVAAAPLWMMLSWALVRYFAPEAGGSGIPQILATIEQAAEAKGRSNSPWQNARVIIVKILSSIAAILGGGTVGREGPTIQISASIFDIFDAIFKKYTGGRRTREALLIAGGGAGLAAAFNTPLGGVVFAIEELANLHFKTFKGSLILTVVTAGYVTQAVLGPYLFIGHPSIGVVSGSDTAVGLAAAVVIGVAGALFGVALFRLVGAVGRLSAAKRLILAAVVGVIMSAVCVKLGPDASGGGSLLIRKLLFSMKKDVTNIGWMLAMWRVIGLTLTYISGCAGGIFAPSLAAGAAIGAMLANTFAFDNPNLMIVLGMIAFLTGATRSPFTCFILVFEMTDRQAAVIPMMAAALLANVAARLVEGESFYEKMRDVLLGRHIAKIEEEPRG